MIIDKDNKELDIYSWSYKSIPILELKRWVDAQIENGMNTITSEISWGYYNDIDAIIILAKQ